MSYKIIGVGGYLPSKIVTNHELEKTLDTSDEWIISRTGIKQRHIADVDEATSDLALQASRSALLQANLSIGDIDLIICATTTPDLSFPATAAILSKKLGASNMPAFDLQAVCSGFVYGLHLSEKLLQSGAYKKILLVGAEKMSSLIDWQDRNTAVLFGDGAGAVILSAEPNNFSDSLINSDATEYEILQTTGGVSSGRGIGVIEMKGQAVFKHAVAKMSLELIKLLKKHQLSTNDIDHLVCHQANIRIIDNIGQSLNLEEEKIVKTISGHANCSAASIPLALSELYIAGKLQKGQLLGFCAMGAGLTWGGALLKW
ncbi:MAG: ketoacyl-ACP synthase III [Rickettsiaceae bacterium]|nr:ketoacyl-ACP synthase III [Rickettsiaceae bacterium]